MMEVLQFIFSSFWIFIGTLVLMSAGLHGLAAIFLAMRGKG